MSIFIGGSVSVGVSSVNSLVGSVVINTGNVPEVTNKKYSTDDQKLKIDKAIGQNFKFADSNSIYKEGAANNAWEVAGVINFKGKSVEGTPESFKALVSNSAGGGGAKVRIIDIDNSDAVIGEAISGVTGTTPTLIEENTLENLSVNAARWEIQIARLPSTGKARIFSMRIS